MFCPKCEGEFVAGIETCSDCGVRLVEALAPRADLVGRENEGEHPDPTGPLVRFPLRNASDSVLVQSLLRGAGFAFRVHPGFGEMWDEVFVREADVPEIREFLKDYRSQRGFDEDRFPIFD